VESDDGATCADRTTDPCGQLRGPDGHGRRTGVRRRDRRFRAFDSKTGKELWVTKLGAVGNANPISYRARNGKQCVAIVATDQVVVFALP
jgi:hypothetical protein